MSSKGKIPLLIDSEGAKHTKSGDKATALNKQFSSVFTHDDVVVPPFPARTNSVINTVDTSVDNVLKVLRKLPAKTSCGPDGIPSILLKNCATALAVPLSIIFKTSIETGKVPQDWLCANIVPIYKRK